MSEVTSPILTDVTGQEIVSKLNTLLTKMDNLAAAFQPNASGIVYSNTTSGLTGDDVQEAIDEMAGDVSEINSALSDSRNYPTDSTELLIGKRNGKNHYRKYLHITNVTVNVNTSLLLSSIFFPTGAGDVSISDKSMIISGSLHFPANCMHSAVYVDGSVIYWRQSWSSSATWELQIWVEYTKSN